MDLHKFEVNYLEQPRLATLALTLLFFAGVQGGPGTRSVDRGGDTGARLREIHQHMAHQELALTQARGEIRALRTELDSERKSRAEAEEVLQASQGQARQGQRSWLGGAQPRVRILAPTISCAKL